MGRLLAPLAAALDRLRIPPVPRYWTPRSLDPYGILPVMDAMAERDSDTVVALERSIPADELPRRASA